VTTFAAPAEQFAADKPREIIARLERLPIGRDQIFTRVVVGSATFFEGYASLAIASALPVLMGLWQMSAGDVGIILGASYVGQLIGALLFGWLAEKIGRLPVLTITVVIFTVMSFLTIFAWDAQSLAWMRLLQGIGLGGEVPVAATFINELTSARRRGRYFTLYECAVPAGLLLAGVAGLLLVPVFGWQSVFIFGALPGIVIVPLMLGLKESPRWLIASGQVAKAEAVVSRYEDRLIARGVTLEQPQIDVGGPLPAATAATGSWRELVTGRYLSRTVVVWGLWICAYFIINSLLSWLPTIYRSVFHLPVATAIGLGLATNAAGLCGSLLAAFLIDRIGRKRLFIGAFLACSMLLGLLGALGATSVVQVVALSVSGYFFIAAVGLSLYLYTGELYPTRVRALGTSVATSWLRLASAISPILIAGMLDRGGMRWVALMLAGLALAGGLLAFRAIETRGQVLEKLSP